jgi:hypothetical protein
MWFVVGMWSGIIAFKGFAVFQQSRPETMKYPAEKKQEDKPLHVNVRIYDKGELLDNSILKLTEKKITVSECRGRYTITAQVVDI